MRGIHASGRRGGALVFVLALAGWGVRCGGDDTSPAGAGPDAAPPDSTAADVTSAPDAATSDAGADVGADGSRNDAATCPSSAALQKGLMLDSGAFPGTPHPDVVAHVPAGFDACGRVGLVVYFHGYDNCAANVMGALDTACTDGGAARPSANLAAQLDAARVNAILIAVQLAYDAPTADPGQLAIAGDFRAIVHDTLQALAPSLGKPLDTGDLDRVVVAASSGGYEAAASAASIGGLDPLREIDLYDALYGDVSFFASWIGARAVRFDPARADAVRFVDLYTAAGGTAASSQDLAGTVASALADAGLADAMLDRRDAGPPTPEELAHGAVFALVGGVGDQLPSAYFQALLTASGFAHLP